MATIGKNRVIIDTDPGIDDMLALLLALTAEADVLELLLISVTYGNVGVQSCLRNVVAMFHVIEQERAWRKAAGRPEGFPFLRSRPLVAVGANHPLDDEILMLDYYHGVDGLAGVHESHPHLSPSEAWGSLFHDSESSEHATDATSPSLEAAITELFTASKAPAHQEILRLLRENPPDTVTLICIGPMTNAALAAAEDPETFLRAKDVVVMGGAIGVPGNITPCAEFNTYADAVATARVMALTSPCPLSTMPPPPFKLSTLKAYPSKLSRQLSLTLFPLDLTTPHVLKQSMLDAHLKPLIDAHSPLAEWVYAFTTNTIQKAAAFAETGTDLGMELHDPVCVWYAMTRDSAKWIPSAHCPEDIRVETAGQWTRGMHMIDQRNRPKIGQSAAKAAVSADLVTHKDSPPAMDEHALSDKGRWRQFDEGNRICRMVESPFKDSFAKKLLTQIFPR